MRILVHENSKHFLLYLSPFFLPSYSYCTRTIPLWKKPRFMAHWSPSFSLESALAQWKKTQWQAMYSTVGIMDLSLFCCEFGLFRFGAGLGELGCLHINAVWQKHYREPLEGLPRAWQ